MKIFKLVALILLITSCKTQQLIHTKCNHENKTTIVSLDCVKFYNPFNSNYDSLYLFSSTEGSSAIVRSQLQLRNGKGTFECFVLDTLKVLHCDIIHDKINGKCVKYFLPLCKDTAIVADFKKNKLNGEYRQYGADGMLIINKTYKNGKVIR